MTPHFSLLKPGHIVSLLHMYVHRERKRERERERERVDGGVVSQYRAADEPRFKEEHLLCCHFNLIKTDSYVTV